MALHPTQHSTIPLQRNKLKAPHQLRNARYLSWLQGSRSILAAAILTSAPLQARADVGLNGVFAPQNWSLFNSNIGTPLDSNSYVCSASLVVGCISDQPTQVDQAPPDPPDSLDVFYGMEASGDIFIIGSNRIYDGGSPSDPYLSITEFTVKNTGPTNLALSFGYNFQGFSNPSDGFYPSFTIVAGDNSYTWTSDASTATYTGTFSAPLGNQLFLGTQKDLIFRITTYNNAIATVDNLFTTPSLSINNFQAVEQVPAPLPALGAVSAFAYTRRLRRRIQNSRTSRSPRTPFPDPRPSAPESAELQALSVS